MALRLLLASAAQSRALFQLDAPSRGPQPPPGTWPMALYPLPAVYLPNSQCMLRNIEPRNLAMCREQTHFVSACVTSDSSCCASVGSVLRIDDVRPAASDTSGMVLADPMSSNVLEVRCTVVGRVQLVACQNLEVWRRPQRDYYLMADVAAYDDEVGQASDMSPEAGGEVDDVPDAIYRLVDALTQSSSSADSTDGGLDTDAAVAALEKAATHAEDGEWWEALEIWQTHCATRLAAETTLHRAERNEYVIDAKLRQGGALKIPVEEWCATPVSQFTPWAAHARLSHS